MPLPPPRACAHDPMLPPERPQQPQTQGRPACTISFAAVCCCPSTHAMPLPPLRASAGTLRWANLISLDRPRPLSFSRAWLRCVHCLAPLAALPPHACPPCTAPLPPASAEALGAPTFATLLCFWSSVVMRVTVRCSVEGGATVVVAGWGTSGQPGGGWGRGGSTICPRGMLWAGHRPLPQLVEVAAPVQGCRYLPMIVLAIHNAAPRTPQGAALAASVQHRSRMARTIRLCQQATIIWI